MYIEDALFILVVSSIVLAVYLVIIRMLVKEALDRGYSPDKTKLLWVVGFFLSPILLAIYVLCFLPANSKR